MKHIVTLTISNPAHEHVSLRRRQSTTNYMVEARDEAEAIFRASNHFKKLGNYVHSAVIAESTLNEEVEQIDEAVKVGPANHDKSTDTVWHGVHHNGEEIGTIGTHSAQHVEKHGKWGFEDSRGYGRRHGQPALNSKEEALDALVNRHKEYAKKKANEEVDQFARTKEKIAAMKEAREISSGLKTKLRNFNSELANRHAPVETQHGNITVSSKMERDSHMVTAHHNGGLIATHDASTNRGTQYHNHEMGRKAGLAISAHLKTPAVRRNFPSSRQYPVFKKPGIKDTQFARAIPAAKLAKEEVELDEANARHSPEAAQAVLTPTAKIVRAAVGKTARDKAATKKYARRVAKISPDYSKKDVMDHLKSIGEEVEQIDEVGPIKARTRMLNKIRDARAGAEFKKMGGPLPDAGREHTTPQAFNKAIGRALRRMPEEVVNEKAPPGAKKEKAIAYATAWKAKNAGK